MPSPFPGMDPYLEDPAIWSGFHHTYLTALQAQLSPVLRPKYFVRVEERVYVAHEDDPAYRFIVPDIRVMDAVRGAPIAAGSAPLGQTSGARTIVAPVPLAELIDAEIHEYRLEVLDRADRSVVTVIELLSPTNKVLNSVGRASFLKKRNEVYATEAHWLEIDLLREGARTANLAASSDADYQVFLARAGRPRRGFVWRIDLREPLPVIGVPLREPDADVALDLQSALARVYEIGGYDLDLDYTRPPNPPLPPDRGEWARQRIGATHLQSPP